MPKGRTFWRFIYSYCIVIAVSIVIGSITYGKALSYARSEAILSVQSALEEGKDLIDARIREVENMFIQVAIESEARSLLSLRLPLNDQDFEKMRMLLAKLHAYRLTNSFIRDLCVFYPNTEMFVSADAASSRPHLFYDIYFAYANVPYEEWKKRVSERYLQLECWPAQNITANNISHSAVTFVQSIPIGSYANHRGVIIALIDGSQILQNLSRLEIDSKSWFCIRDEMQNILLSFPADSKNANFLESVEMKGSGYKEISIQGTRMVGIHTASAFTGWTYMAYLPFSIFVRKTEPVLVIYIVMIATTLLAGITVAVFLAGRNSRPLKRIIDMLHGKIESGSNMMRNEFDFIESTLTRLIDSNENLRQEWEKKRPLLRASFLERFFMRGFRNLEEIESQLSYMGMEIEGTSYTVLVARIDGYNGDISKEILKELDIARLLFHEIVTNALGENTLAHNFDNDKIAVLFALRQPSGYSIKAEIELYIKTIIQEMQVKYGFHISIGIGRFCRSLMEVRNSFHEAVLAIEYKWADKKDISWFETIPKGTGRYYYPLDIENRLVQLVKMGEKEEINALLEDIYENNFIQRQLSSEMVNELVSEMKATITKVRDIVLHEDQDEQARINKLLTNLALCQSTRNVFQCLGSIYDTLCDTVNALRRSHNSRLKKSIMEFLSTNYMRNDLNLYMVASEFNLTEKYLSNFFKDQTGETFSDHIENIRMLHAQEALFRSHKTVKEVGMENGYVNANTFYKAFKRRFGASPEVYRRKMKTFQT